MKMTLENPIISKLKKAVTVKMRADVPMNLCANQTQARNDLGGGQDALTMTRSHSLPLIMIMRNSTNLHQDSWTHSRHHVSVRIYMYMCCCRNSLKPLIGPSFTERAARYRFGILWDAERSGFGMENLDQCTDKRFKE